MRWAMSIGVFGVITACSGGGDTPAPEGDNHAPTAPEVSISPLAPTSSEPLTAHIVSDATDADGDPLTYTYVWLRDGAPEAAFSSDTIGASDTTRGETWQVRVIASDGELSGPAGTAEASIANAPPSSRFRRAWRS